MVARYGWGGSPEGDACTVGSGLQDKILYTTINRDNREKYIS